MRFFHFKGLSVGSPRGKATLEGDVGVGAHSYARFGPSSASGDREPHVLGMFWAVENQACLCLRTRGRKRKSEVRRIE